MGISNKLEGMVGKALSGLTRRLHTSASNPATAAHPGPRLSQARPQGALASAPRRNNEAAPSTMAPTGAPPASPRGGPLRHGLDRLKARATGHHGSGLSSVWKGFPRPEAVLQGHTHGHLLGHHLRPGHGPTGTAPPPAGSPSPQPWEMFPGAVVNEPPQAHALPFGQFMADPPPVPAPADPAHLAGLPEQPGHGAQGHLPQTVSPMQAPPSTVSSGAQRPPLPDRRHSLPFMHARTQPSHPASVPRPPLQRRPHSIDVAQTRPHVLETPQLGDFAGPLHAQAELRGATGGAVSPLVAQEAMSNVIGDDIPQASPVSSAGTAQPPAAARPRRPTVEQPRLDGEFPFWDARPQAPRRQSVGAFPQPAVQPDSVAEPHPGLSRRQSIGLLPRMRRNPETQELVPWKIDNGLDEAYYTQAQTQAMVLRQRITGRPSDAFDIKDPLDARCLEAALQGSSAVSTQDIDLSRYR